MAPARRPPVRYKLRLAGAVAERCRRAARDKDADGSRALFGEVQHQDSTPGGWDTISSHVHTKASLKCCQNQLYFLGTTGAVRTRMSFARNSYILRSRISRRSCFAGWVVGESYSIHASFFEHVLKPVDVHVVDIQTNRILAPGRIGSIEEVFAWHGFLSIVVVSLALFALVTVLADFYLRSTRLHSTMLTLRLRSESNFA